MFLAIMTPPNIITFTRDFPAPELALNCLVEEFRSEAWSVPEMLAIIPGRAIL